MHIFNELSRLDHMMSVTASIDFDVNLTNMHMTVVLLEVCMHAQSICGFIQSL